MNSIRVWRHHTLSAGTIAGGIALACLLAACKAPELPTMISPYRIDIQQGNVITQDMISKLKAGMTRAQVRFVLGSPLIVDPFRTDRWDYVSIYEKQGKEVERRRVTIIFEDEKLARIEGDVVAGNGMQKKETTVEVPPLSGKPALTPLNPLTFSKPVAAPASAATAVEKPVDKVMLDPANPVTFSKPPAAATPVVTEPAKAPATAAETTTPAAIDAPPADTPKPALPAAADAKGEGANADAAKPAAAAPAADEKKADAAKKDEPKDKPKQPGLFGRILEKLGI